MSEQLPGDERLPVDECLSEVTSALAESRPIVLVAPPGAGKTTRVPPAILRDFGHRGGKVLLLQPRRIAARSAAYRLSREAGEAVGETFGYQVRFDRKVSRQTQVVAMTTGVLLRRLTTDPLLEDVSCVIFDEFHERSLELDLALGMLHRVRTTLRPELRLVVMSATLEVEPVLELMSDAVSIRSEGRSYEVDLHFSEQLHVVAGRRKQLVDHVHRQLTDALKRTDGDVLVFLPGVGEIRQVAKRVDELVRRSGSELHELFGDLSPEAQDAVIQPSSVRKVILATNIAETSVTIPGVTCVIDSGLARVMEYDAAVGVPHLALRPISQASAEQRAGRAGRTAPGVCYRLWPRAVHRSRPAHTPAEIRRSDFSAALLTLAAWGERDVFAFPWVTVPTPDAVASAKQLLVRLGAVTEDLEITSLGSQMLRFPVHPRLARMLIAGADHGCLEVAAIAAALLSERDPFRRAAVIESDAKIAGEDDLLHRVLRLKRYWDGGGDEQVLAHPARRIARVAQRLQRLVDSNAGSTSPDELRDGRFARALLTAYPDRLARRRRAGAQKAVMVGGRGVRLDQASTVVNRELFVCVEVRGKAEDAQVGIATGVDRDWLPQQNLCSRTEVLFHPTLKAVVARKRVYFEDLMLEESPAPCEADETSAELLFRHARQHLMDLLPRKDRKLQSFLDRWRFLSKHASEEQLPGAVDECLESVLDELCQTRTSFKELSNAPWLDYLQGCFRYEQLCWLDDQAPESIVVPSGNRIRVEYAADKPPVLAVRIQEIFGWKETPRLAGGKVAVQLHLLAPNRRPQQITEDLPSFWETTYHQIRKDLRRRYAKHHWPEDPGNATATRNGLKPKK